MATVDIPDRRPKHFQYPTDLGDMAKGGQHWMLISAMKTSKSRQTTAGSNAGAADGIDPHTSWALYIPPGAMKTGYKGKYSGLAGGRRAIGMGGGSAEVLSSAWAGVKLGTGMATGSEVSAETKADANMSAITGAFNQTMADALGAFGPAGKLIQAKTGVAKNDHMALVYDGPGEFRTHSFSFTFTPKSHKESNQVMFLTEAFKTSMLPDIGGLEKSQSGAMSGLDSAFFKYPDLFTIEFYSGARRSWVDPLIQPSVLESMDIDHGTQNLTAFHEHGHPVTTTLNLSFRETTHVINKADRSGPSHWDSSNLPSSSH